MRKQSNNRRALNVRQSLLQMRRPSAATTIALAAALFAGLSWWEAHSGSRTAEKQADAAVLLARTARQQAVAARDLVRITASQAAAAKAQADATRAQANAAALLVQVQRENGQVEARLAASTASVQAPGLAPLELEAEGLGLPDSYEGRANAIMWHYTNVGGSALWVETDRAMVAVAPKLPDHFAWDTFANLGGGSQAVSPRASWGPPGWQSFKINEPTANALAEGKAVLFVAERISYHDSEGARRVQCFLLVAKVIGRSSTSFDNRTVPQRNCPLPASS